MFNRWSLNAPPVTFPRKPSPWQPATKKKSCTSSVWSFENSFYKEKPRQKCSFTAVFRELLLGISKWVINFTIFPLVVKRRGKVPFPLRCHGNNWKILSETLNKSPNIECTGMSMSSSSFLGQFPEKCTVWSRPNWTEVRLIWDREIVQTLEQMKSRPMKLNRYQSGLKRQ